MMAIGNLVRKTESIFQCKSAPLVYYHNTSWKNQKMTENLPKLKATTMMTRTKNYEGIIKQDSQQAHLAKETKWFHPGSNRRPFACEANVITNYTMKPDIK